MKKFNLQEWKKQNKLVVSETSLGIMKEANADNKHIKSDTITPAKPIFFWDGDDDEVGITVRAPFK